MWKLKKNLEAYTSKQNTNTNTLSRIEINAFENESMNVNTRDHADELENI